MMGLLLDTHVWIWLMEGLPNLTKKHQNIINEAAQNSKICIAAISLWEISMLAMKGRIILKKPPLTWINESLALPGLSLCPFTPDIAVDSCEIKNFHFDPADRLIISTARINSLTLLTHDKKIIDYAKTERISVMAI